MLRAISWLSYLKTMLFIIALFYLAVLILYYKQEIRTFINSKLLGKTAESKKRDMDNNKDPGIK